MNTRIPDRTDLNTLSERHRVHYKTLRRAFSYGATAVRGKARERCRAAIDEWERICVKDERRAADLPGRAP